MGHRGSCCDVCQRVFCLFFFFPSRSFIVSGLKFRSLIHFEFIFVYGVRKCSSFILLQVVDQSSQHHLLEIIFFPLYILASFVKDKVSMGAWIYLWAFYFVPLIYISVFVPVPYCLDNCGFVVEPEVRQVDSSIPQFHSSFSRLLWLFEAFCISIQIVKLFVLVL